MRRFSLTLLVVFAALSMGRAQDPVADFRQMLEKGRVSFDYEYVLEGKVPLTGKGKVTVQGRMYTTEGNGLKIWCDSLTRWTLDVEAKEAYIESVSTSPDILSDPVPYLSSLSDLKVAKDRITGVYKADKANARFTITNIKPAPAASGNGDFVFDTATLDKSWVVTDLR